MSSILQRVSRWLCSVSGAAVSYLVLGLAVIGASPQPAQAGGRPPRTCITDRTGGFDNVERALSRGCKVGDVIGFSGGSYVSISTMCDLSKQVVIIPHDHGLVEVVCFLSPPKEIVVAK